MINGHGDEYVGELKANFSSNVWLGADHSELYQHLFTRMPLTRRYPETSADSLQSLLADKHKLDPNQIIICNGSTEAFYLIAQSFYGASSLVVTPTFSEYADACLLHKHQLLTTRRSDLVINIEKHQPNLVWICNPNNPDGYCFSAFELKQLISSFPSSIFVIDQAYIDFTLQDGLLNKEVSLFDNLIIVQSLTKRYAIPGLRLGYLAANKKIADIISLCRIPWSVNTLAIEAGKYLLQHNGGDFQLEQLLSESADLQAEINSLNCFETMPSQTPYFLVNLKNGSAEDLKEFLLTNKILIRQATNFDGLEGEYIRICSQTPKENKLLIERLKEWEHKISQ